MIVIVYTMIAKGFVGYKLIFSLHPKNIQVAIYIWSLNSNGLIYIITLHWNGFNENMAKSDLLTRPMTSRQRLVDND